MFLKPDKIFINIPKKYMRFNEVIGDNQLTKFNSNIIEITRCKDCGPGTKLLGSLDKLKNNSLVILTDDDNIYADYMIEKFYHSCPVIPVINATFFIYKNNFNYLILLPGQESFSTL